MRIQGNLATYEFSDLLQWLAQGNKTGVLKITDGEVEYELGFDHGGIDMSSSSDPTQRLDNYLYSKELIDQTTLARAERLRDATKMMSGQVLVTLGAVSEEQLAQALRDKTEAILCELLTWDQGTFEFEGGDRPETTMVPINLEVTKLLLESMHRLDQQRGGQPVSEEQPAAAFLVAAPEKPAVPPDATQAIEGLALAEVLDPENAPAVAAGGDATPLEEMVGDQLPPHYAVMTQAPGPLRRLAPFAMVALFSVAVGVFYLADRQANAETVGLEPAGEVILFTQTRGPAPSRIEPVVAAAPLPAAQTAQPAADLAATEEALRRRYEGQLAKLRKELEEARRVAPATARTADAATGRPAPAELPADSMIRAAVSRPVLAPAVAEAQPSQSATQDRTPPAAVLPAAPPAAELPTPALTEPEPVTPPAAEPAPAPTRHLELINPRLLKRPLPEYPSAARRLGRGTSLTIRLLIDADGRVAEIERVGPKAGLGFDRAAEEAARASTWEPGTRNGEPTEMWAELRFEFKP